ncbi:hypothetical protein OG266_38565 [Streptomyces sp. NBC_00554]|uniref:hypothetical protein n=1 Tax=Streptomyces sp. NBC_00554 TaxID=2903661 RepID=UPI00352D9C18|nr:hypothetical protein OG266_38565 [Streptomyces sp. NBC_00554]
MPSPGPKTIAIGGVVASTAIGIVINMVTSRWSWTLAGVLAVLVTASAWIAVRALGSGAASRTRVLQVATRRGRITSSGVTARGEAFVSQKARARGDIVRSPIAADGADVCQRATDRGRIEDAPVDGA